MEYTAKDISGRVPRNPPPSRPAGPRSHGRGNLNAFEELVVRLQRRVYEVSGAGYVAPNAFSYQATSQ